MRTKFEILEGYNKIVQFLKLAEQFVDTHKGTYLLPLDTDSEGNLNFGVTVKEYEIWFVIYGEAFFAQVGEDWLIINSARDFKALIKNTDHFVTMYKLKRSVMIEDEKNGYSKPAQLFNPEILSNIPTHFDKYRKNFMKVFTTYEAYNPANDFYCAEIMDGEAKGKHTTGNIKNLIKL
jgi:hypothetical protein